MTTRLRHLWVCLAVLGISQGACSVRFNWPRHVIDVRVVTQTQTSAPHTPVWANLDRVELVPCEDQTRGYAARLLAKAHAHGVSTDTILAVHHVLNLSDDDATLGQWTPPAGSYCEVDVLFAPADDDAIGLARQPALRGHSAQMGAQRTTRKIGARLRLQAPVVLPEDDDTHRRMTLLIHTDSPSSAQDDWVEHLGASIDLEEVP